MHSGASGLEHASGAAGDPGLPGLAAPDAVRRDHYLVLDGLRGFAAFAICLVHLAHISHHRLGDSLERAFLAVDFFFVLSGVVIADRYEQQLMAGSFVRAFLLRRAIRLYPMVALGTLAGLGVMLLGRWLHTGPAPRFAVLAAATLWNGLLLPLSSRPWWGWGLWPFNPPFWSLFCELVVNGLYALAILQLRGRRIVVPVAGAAAMLVWHCAQGGTLQQGGDAAGLMIGMCRAVFGFGLGVIIARLHAAGRLPKTGLPGGAAMVVLVLVLWGPFSRGWGAAYDLVAIMLVMPWIVMAGLRTGPVVHGARLYATLGLISYPLYATHEVLFRMVLAVLLWRHHSGILVRDGSLVMLFVTAVVVSHALARFYDLPARAWLARRIIFRARPG